MKTTAKPLTTGIGSLPHHNVDTALEFSFQMSIPFLPQIPIRNPWEYMIAQALEGLPGLQIEPDGSAFLNMDVWESRSQSLNQRLSRAFEEAGKVPSAFEEFEPSGAASSSWQPFVWELQEREIGFAKYQIAGPLTSQWAIRIKGGESVEKYPELSTQIFRLVLARSIAMGRRLKSLGVQPLLYLDEPALYGLSPTNPKHVLGLQELKLMIQALRKEQVQVGLHCCSNTHWPSILSLPLDYLSLDVALSLESILEEPGALTRFIHAGGKLSLGVIPTTRSSALHSLNLRELFEQMIARLSASLSDSEVRSLLKSAIYTPACGLAFQSISDAELIQQSLIELSQMSQSFAEG